MFQYNKVNAKLLDSQLNKLRYAVKNQTEVTLKKWLWKCFKKTITSWIFIDNKRRKKIKKCIWE